MSSARFTPNALFWAISLRGRGKLAWSPEEGGGYAEAVHPGDTVHGSDLSGGHEACLGRTSQATLDFAGVVAGIAEEVAAAAGTRDHQTRRGLPLVDCRQIKRHGKVLASSGRISHKELHGRTDPNRAVEEQRAVAFVCGRDGPYEKVVAAELALLRIGDYADQRSLGKPGTIFVAQRAGHRLNRFDCGTAAEALERRAVGAGDDHRLADGAAAVAQHGFHLDVALQNKPNGAGIQNGIVGREDVGTGLASTADEAPEDGGGLREFTRDACWERVASCGERIGEEEHPARWRAQAESPLDEFAAPDFGRPIVVVEGKRSNPASRKAKGED